MTKIDLVFSSGYDGFVYKKDNNLFNKKYVGEMQLLGLLERELGLSGEFKTVKERQAEYLEYVSNEIEGAEVFISESFKNDNIGVANELLRWRDQLKLCNWEFKKGCSVRLDLLADIETKNEMSLGVSDRWLLVVKSLRESTIININCIEINDNIELLHPFFNELFKILKEKGVAISIRELESCEGDTNLSKIKNLILKNESGVELNRDDDSFQVIKFQDTLISSDFLAQQLSRSELSPVIINSNNYSLDTSFLTYNLPLSGSEISSANPQIIQLFKLIGALLFSNVNPYNLLSLLNLPVLPFPKGLAIKLSRVLINNAGVGNDEWQETIRDFKESFDKNKTNRKEQLRAIEFYIDRQRVDEVAKGDLIDIYRDLTTWSAKMLSISESDLKMTQFSNLHILSKSFIKTIESISQDRFTARELDRITSKIYEPINIRINEKEKGSANVISTPGQLHDQPDVLVWFDFYNSDLSAPFGDFLLQSEIEELKKQDGFLLWERENQIESQLNVLKKGILKPEKKLCLFISEKIKGETTKEHPIFTQLSASINNFQDFVHEFSFDNPEVTNFDWLTPSFEKSAPIGLPQKKSYLEINNKHLLKERDQESYSSMDMLIQYPMDWILNYQAKISDKGLIDIDQLMTLKGNLSHTIVQTLLENEKNGMLNLRAIHLDSEIDALLKKITPQIASPFFLDENKIEYATFTTQLKRSVKVLLEIIENNNLLYDSFEYKAIGKINGIEFSGDVDLLFYKGNIPVVIDLKWTYSSSKYTKILKDEKSIQLAVYAKLLNNSSAITAYFLLSDAILCTTSNKISGEAVRQIKLIEDELYVNDRIIKKTMNSFNYRWNEFEEGKIESAEEMSLESVQYHIDSEEKELIQLDGDGKIKKANPYSNYGLFKGMVK